jgi:hypothetical protein
MVRSKGERPFGMPAPVELVFKIQAYTPETMPMERLAQYLLDLAIILGERQSVHFSRVEGGSTAPVVHVDWEALPKVMDRANAVKNNEGPEEAKKAKAALERRLADDNASGAELQRASTGARVLYFRGRDERLTEPEYGPFNQPGQLTGTVIVIGGKNDPVSVHLQDGERIYFCHAKRDVARQLARHMFGAPVRVRGVGRWFRNRDGTWEMRGFRIADFVELDPASLREVLNGMRAIKAGWRDIPDPIGFLRSANDE